MRIRTGLRRTTTQMLNNSRRKTGTSSRRSSLLGTLQNKGVLGNSRLSALNANCAQSTRLTKASYEKLQRSSASLAEQTKLLAEKIAVGGKDITATAASMVGHFNDTLKNLTQASGVLNDYYRQTLKEAAANNRPAFEEIGITVAADGSLSLNKDKLAGADEEKIKKALGGASDFAKQVNAIATRVADNAKASAESVSSQYNSSGSLASSYLSRYNFRG